MDIPPKNGDFDDRMYYRLRNLLVAAMRSSAFTRHRLLIYSNNELRFFNECKELNEVKIKLPTENFFETMKYLFAIEKRNWILIFEPDYSEDKVIYPGDRTKQLFDEE